MKIKISPPKELTIEIPQDEFVDIQSKSEVVAVDQKLDSMIDIPQEEVTIPQQESPKYVPDSPIYAPSPVVEVDNVESVQDDEELVKLSDQQDVVSQ